MKSKTVMIQERDEEIHKLRTQVADLEKATHQVGTSIDAILYEVIKKYGDEFLEIRIAVPDVKTAPKITASKEDDAYVIRVKSETEEG